MRALAAATLLAVLCAAFAGTARADVATVVDDGNGPWAGGVAATSALEAVAGTIASTIAGRTVSVRCESDADWATLAQLHSFPPTSVLGFVSFSRRGPGDYAELSPTVCGSLQTFAAAAAKPTKCAATTSTPQSVFQTVRERVVKTVKGRKVVTYRTRTVEKVTYVDVVGPLGPCFANGTEGRRGDQPFWNAYFYTAEAIQTLVHEAFHLKGNGVEAEAECYGMQSLASAAQQLGDTPDDAAAIAQYYATRLYPSRQSQSPDYWSAECKPNGALDLTPNDGVWP